MDHKDHDTLNNRRENLRIATHAQNLWNTKILANNTSGFKGVSFFKPRGTWRSRIMLNGKQNLIGYFDSPEEAGAAYVEAAKRLHGEFANW